jgi:hypothetical protein
MEITYLLKLSLTPKRKVASYFGRLCEEENKSFQLINNFLKKKLSFMLNLYFCSS